MKMIIVDDERISREGMLDFINWREDYGIEIAGTAANGKEGYELYRAVQPDIVLTDIKMPMMSGIEMAEAIRADDQKVRIVLLSAYSEFSYAQKALKTKVDDYLLKPVEEDELRHIMDRIAAENLEQNLSENSKRKFLSVLEGKHDPALCSYRFQVFILGKEPGCHGARDDLWLMEFHEGGNVGIARYRMDDEFEGIGRASRWGFEFVYAGSRVDCPEEIRKSYNEAVLIQYIGQFWELKELDYMQLTRRREQWNKHEADIQCEMIKLADEIRAAIQQQDRARVEATVHRTIHYLSQSQGIDPSCMEEFVMRLVTRIAQMFTEFKEIKASLWEFRMMIQSHDRFQKIKATLMTWLMEWAGRVEEKQRQSDTTIVQKVIGIIQQEYSHDINLRMIADRVYLSPNYLGAIFRNATDMYFNDYLVGFRMQKATELLLTSPDKVAKIGEAVGIPNTSYFSSLFKKTFGVTPKEYRRNTLKQG